MDASDERWRQVLCQLVSLCECLSEVVSPVVCSSSPEGLLLEGDGKSSGTDPSSVGGGGSDDNDPSTVGSAQSLLLCCWHTMKEVSLLLGYLVENWNVVGPTKTLLLAQEQVIGSMASTPPPLPSPSPLPLPLVLPSLPADGDHRWDLHPPVDGGQASWGV